MEDWYAKLHVEVLRNKELTLIDKVLYSVILNYKTTTKGCFASNKFLAELIGCSVRSIQNSLAALEEKGWVIRKMTMENRTTIRKLLAKEVEEICTPPVTQLHTPHAKNNTTPVQEMHTNNIDTNNIEKKNILKENEIDKYLSLAYSGKTKAADIPSIYLTEILSTYALTVNEEGVIKIKANAKQ